MKCVQLRVIKKLSRSDISSLTSPTKTTSVLHHHPSRSNTTVAATAKTCITRRERDKVQVVKVYIF